jgi:hypothetical protein
MTKRWNLYHLASILLLIFFVGHTFGGVISHHDISTQQESVLNAMRSEHFRFNGADVTYFGFYRGYGLLISIFLLLSAFLSWQLARSGAQGQMASVWALFFAYVGVAWISFQDFFAGPGIVAAAVALIFGYKCLTSRRHPALHS